MRKAYLFLLLCCSIVALKSNAQTAASYVFSQTTTTYTANSSPTNIFTGVWDDNVTNGLSIGFNFTYCGTTYTTFNINANGWINFGSSTTSSYTPISARTLALSPFGNDLYYNSSYSGTVTSQVTGSSPSRVLTIQWLNCCHYSTATTGPLNFQIKLYEGSNVIDFVYGSCAPTTSGSYTPQVGINGASSSDYNNRTTTSNWSTTTAGTSSSATCTQTQTIVPSSGLVFRWTPPCSSVPVPTGASSVCVGSTITLSDATSGGTWSSGGTSATVNSSGVVTGVATGSVSILYTVSGCSANKTITIPPSPVITATATPSVICSGGTTTLAGSGTNPGATYGVSGITFAPVSFTPTGTFNGSTSPTSGTNDDGYYTVSLPFSFTLFGTTYTAGSSAYIGTNGYVTFGSGSTSTYASSFPNTGFPAALSLVGRDMDLRSTGSITYGTTGTAPNRIFVISYNAVPDYGSSSTETGQVLIYEGTGVIDYQITTAVASTHTIGIQDNLGSSYLTVSGQNYTSTGVTNTGYRFSLPNPTFTWAPDPTLSSSTVPNPTAGPLTATHVYTAIGTASNGCSATNTVTVTISPSPTALTGTTTLCQALTTTLSSSVGGTWSSSNTNIATVVSGSSSTGTVSGIASGSATITYSFGSSCYVTQAVTVLPTAPVTGPTSVCPGLTITMSDALSGGTWTSSNNSFATVNSSSGIVTGVGAGNPDISYTLPNGCSRSLNITVNPLPAVITGSASVCQGLSTLLTETSTGGTWTTSSTTIASIGALSSTTASAFGGSAGTAVITYTLPTTCIRTLTVTVNPLPTAIIAPALGICLTDVNNPAIALSDATPLGTWSSSVPAVAPINTTTGSITGVTTGTTQVTYTLPTTCIITANVTVNQLPAAISGNKVVCANAVTYLTDSLFGGTWSSSNNTMATVTVGTGVVTGIAGYSTPVNPIIKYTSIPGCVAVTTLTVNPAPGVVSGSSTVCVGSATTLSSAGGGSWTSSNSSLATVTSLGGIVTGVAVGNPGITYTLPVTGCFTIKPMTVNPTPAAITPATAAVCYGSTITLNNATPGGAWTTSSTTATVSSGGTVTPTFAGGGVANINYVLSTGCKSTQAVTINTQPTVYNLASAMGASSYCYNDSGIDLYLNSSATTAYYQLYRNGVVLPGTIPGTGGALHFGNQAGAGTYTAVATTTATGCTNNMTGAPAISINPLPVAVHLTYTGTASAYCDLPGGGLPLYLDSSQVGVDYELFFNGLPVSFTHGTGSTLGLGVDTQGTYKVIAINTTTNCKSDMSGIVTVTKNPLPKVHNVIVSDSGMYCVGSLGVHVGLDFGNSGISYELYNGGSLPITTKAGTNSALDFGLKTAGNYTVLARNTTTGCTNNMNGTGIVNVRPLPVASYPVSAKTAGYCVGGAGDTVSLGNSDIGTSYQLMNGTTLIDSPIAGTGAKLSFGPQFAGGTYTVYARIIGSSCGLLMSTSANIAVYPALLKGNVTLQNNGQYCAGGAGVQVFLDTSSSGVVYEVYNAGGGSPILGPVAGTGGKIVFPGLDSFVGATTVLATSTGAGGCQALMNGAPVVKINPLPIQEPVTATNGGYYCVGGTGVNIGIGFSDAGVDYQLYQGVTPIGSPKHGAGSSLDFGKFTTAGIYTVKGKNQLTSCENTMSGSAVVTVNPTPPVYNVTGGGSYCVGTTVGVPVGVFSTTPGVKYQLYHNSIMTGTALAGSGLAISFGNQLTTGLYSVIGTDSVTGCASDMSGSKVITTDALPTAYNVTGGGDYCVGGTGVHVGLANSVTGVDYNLMNGGLVLATLSGLTGNALDFGVRTASGVYTIQARTFVSKCVSDMTGAAIVHVNPLPVQDSVLGGGGYCAGGSGADVYMATSQPGVNYKLYISGVPAAAPAVMGTGGKLDLGLIAAGTYNVIATDAATTCTSLMPGTVTIHADPLPNAYAVTGGGTMCAGDPGFHIYLSGTQTGRSYSLYNTIGGSPVAVVSGTGGAIDFGAQTGSGAYTVIGTDKTSGCMRNMTGAGDINVNPLPLDFTVTGGGNYCKDGAGLLVGLASSENGINYQLTRSGNPVGLPVGGTGSPISFGLQTIGDSLYTVRAVNYATNCAKTMASTTYVKVDVPAIPKVKIDSANSGVACIGEAVHYVATPTNGGAMPTYVWKVNGVVVSLANSITNIPATGDRISVEMTSDATCLLTNKAADELTMIAIPYATPVAMVTADPGNNVCHGTPVSFHATVGFEGNHPGYAWMKNGVFVGAGTSYKYTPNTGDNKDVVVFMLRSDYHCITADTVFSDPIVMMVDTAIVPDFSITAKFGPMKDAVGVGQVDTFTATINTNKDYTYTYQWYIQGAPVVGANGPVYIDHGVYDNDEVSCEVTKVGACGNQTSSRQTTVTLKNLGASQVAATTSDISILPNPNKGEFLVKGTLGTASNEEVSLELTNMLGQTVYSNKVMARNGEISERVKLNNGIANGMYLLSIRSGNTNNVFHVVIEQ